MSDENDLQKEVVLKNEQGGTETFTLAALAGINLDQVEELRFEALPKGVYIFEVEEAKLGAFGEGDKAKAGVGFKAKVLQVVHVQDNEFTGDPMTLVGKTHFQTLFITQEKSLGYIKANFKDIGAPYDSNFLQLLAKSTGTRFQAPVTKRKDPNDSDKEYTQINFGKAKPLAGEAASEVAAALGGAKAA